MVRDDAEPILALLRARGGRVTTSRRAILESFLGVGGHVTAEALTTRVQIGQPDVHESTVYRFLDELERLGVVDHVHLGHGPAVYHLASDAHHHLVCEGCGKVVEVPPTTTWCARGAGRSWRSPRTSSPGCGPAWPTTSDSRSSPGTSPSPAGARPAPPSWLLCDLDGYATLTVPFMVGWTSHWKL
jgi:Fe2+ or Zn2+ uptake regulation protein